MIEWLRKHWWVMREAEERRKAREAERRAWWEAAANAAYAKRPVWERDPFKRECRNCRHWAMQDVDFRRRCGEFVVDDCRRHAPVHGPHYTGDGFPGRQRDWPKTRADECCGDFEQQLTA